MIYFCRCCISDAEDPKKDNEHNYNSRKSKIKQNINKFCCSFDFPFCFVHLHSYWDILVLCHQELENGVESDNTEGVEHGEDHPDVDHLDVGSHGQRLGDTDKA